MKLVSHRGNLLGREPEKENSPIFVENAISKGLDVEIDVWSVDDKLFLGHDFPQYEISEEWLLKKPLWCHAKNKEGLHRMLLLGVNCFWHENDRYTLTSKGFLWCYPEYYSKYGITVDLSDKPKSIEVPSMGICTDIPLAYQR